jgi:hypothetical protein
MTSGMRLTLPRTALLLALATVSVSAQTRDAKKCNGPIYGSQDVTRQAKVIESPDMSVVADMARKYNFEGEIHAELVLCRNGLITDIHIINRLPENLAEFATAAISTMQFTPAEVNWHSVSQRILFEFSINGRGVSGVSEIDPAHARGRGIEEVDFIGNRRITKEQILGWTKTRPGQLFNQPQVQQDLLAISATGFFDSTQTRVILEDASRGGVRVIFYVVELPLIVDVKFEGLKEVDQSAIIAEFLKQHVDIQKGTPLDLVKLKQAERVIRIFFESQGWRGVKTQAFVESLSGTEVAVTFKVTAYKFGS